MSGGHFNYYQSHIQEIAHQIEHIIHMNGKEDDLNFSPKTIRQLKKAVRALKVAYVYAQRADWLFSFDDGEESFHSRLKQELSEIK